MEFCLLLLQNETSDQNSNLAFVVNKNTCDQLSKESQGSGHTSKVGYTIKSLMKNVFPIRIRRIDPFKVELNYIFSKSVLDIRTRLMVTVEPETKWIPNSDSASKHMPKCKILGQYDLPNYFTAV